MFSYMNTLKNVVLPVAAVASGLEAGPVGSVRGLVLHSQSPLVQQPPKELEAKEGEVVCAKIGSSTKITAPGINTCVAIELELPDHGVRCVAHEVLKFTFNDDHVNEKNKFTQKKLQQAVESATGMQAPVSTANINKCRLTGMIRWQKDQFRGDWFLYHARLVQLKDLHKSESRAMKQLMCGDFWSADPQKPQEFRGDFSERDAELEVPMIQPGTDLKKAQTLDVVVTVANEFGPKSEKLANWR